jgi:hypothetical protein
MIEKIRFDDRKDLILSNGEFTLLDFFKGLCWPRSRDLFLWLNQSAVGHQGKQTAARAASTNWFEVVRTARIVSGSNLSRSEESISLVEER